MSNGQTGQREAIVNQQQALVNQLEAEKRDKAYAQKALVANRESEGLIVDPLTGETFRETTVILNVGTWTPAINTPGTPTVIATTIVPNGVVYYFRAVKSDVDRNAPYLYGVLADVAKATIVGTVRFRVFDASMNQLKGQPWTGSCAELAAAAAAPTNWFTRLFFNSRVPVRAQPGDQMVIELNGATAIVWANSYLFVNAIQLTKQY
jgi:hypothetical protein